MGLPSFLGQILSEHSMTPNDVEIIQDNAKKVETNDECHRILSTRNRWRKELQRHVLPLDSRKQSLVVNLGLPQSKNRFNFT